jgi:hypothetical protein
MTIDFAIRIFIVWHLISISQAFLIPIFVYRDAFRALQLFRFTIPEAKSVYDRARALRIKFCDSGTTEDKLKQVMNPQCEAIDLQIEVTTCEEQYFAGKPLEQVRNFLCWANFFTAIQMNHYIIRCVRRMQMQQPRQQPIILIPVFTNAMKQSLIKKWSNVLSCYEEILS